MARIVTVYEDHCRPFVPSDMSYVRWLKMSEALAALGHEVDVATREPSGIARAVGGRVAGALGLDARRDVVAMGPRLRRVPLERVRWRDYDVVKTLFHIGFETLERRGGAHHPCIVAKLGSVVDCEDRPGVYFYGDRRRELFAVQERIAARSRVVTVLTEPSRARWQACFGTHGTLLLVPGAVDAELASAGADPYPVGRPRCLFAGNVYDPVSQPEAHATLVAKLNGLGRVLAARGIRLCFMGPGARTGLDATVVEDLGVVPYAASWPYLQRADVGLVLALGPVPNENESTKIYHYLRAGLPTVCESGFPNEGLIEAAGLGRVVANGDLAALADAVEASLGAAWDRARAIAFVLAGHTWRHRAGVYDAWLRSGGGRA
jgi:hypothetical protein